MTRDSIKLLAFVAVYVVWFALVGIILAPWESFKAKAAEVQPIVWTQDASGKLIPMKEKVAK